MLQYLGFIPTILSGVALAILCLAPFVIIFADYIPRKKDKPPSIIKRGWNSIVSTLDFAALVTDRREVKKIMKVIWSDQEELPL